MASGSSSKKFLEKEFLSLLGGDDDESVSRALAHEMDDLLAGGAAEADPRINWRVTAQHANYFIHIMAHDKNFWRFALSLQTKADFEECLKSQTRAKRLRYEVTSISGLKPILDEIYKRFEHEEGQRRQQERIDEAVEKERTIWIDRLARSRTKRLQVAPFSLSVVSLLLLIGINEYFNEKPGKAVGKVVDAALVAAGTAMMAFIAVVFIYTFLVWVMDKFGMLGKSGKTTPRIGRLILASGWIVFLVLWAVLTYLVGADLFSSLQGMVK
jgi:hypothetical protein